MSLGTAPFLSRYDWNRPKVIPQHTTNLACIGQFVEIADDVTSSMKYSVHGAQVAVAELIGLPRNSEKIKKNILLEVLDLVL